MKKTVKDKANKKTLRIVKRLLPEMVLEFVRKLIYIAINYNISDIVIRNKIDNLYVVLVFMVFKYKRIGTKRYRYDYT